MQSTQVLQTYQGKHVLYPDECDQNGKQFPKIKSIHGWVEQIEMGGPWDHGNLEASEGADAQTCDGTDQNFDYTSEGYTKSRVQLVDRPGHSIRIDQKCEVREPREGIQG
jgi:hypothetical protein